MNKLTSESSVYLKQHQENPVNWWPYCPEAILEAQKEKKPIFLSVGYSTCHWCHVMAHESFEDEKTAKFLNENFICIKVDREEHPDLDTYYQKACQLYTGRGGWPLSTFLTPQMKPFFVGTYFPLHARQDIPSFMEVLEKLVAAYKNEQETIISNSESLTTAIDKNEASEKKIEFQGHFPPPSAIMNALKDFQDNEYGGYGQAPKFPHFAFFEWAVEQTLEGMLPQEQADHIVKSIEKMLCGGIYDHARGGIHRYSVDDMWMVPHFEKMLYDQAGLLRTLSKLSLTYPSPIIIDSLMQTLDYLKVEMQHEQGHFFAAQDADSEGREGLYFTFTQEEFEKLLDEDIDKEKIKKWFQINKEGNFEGPLNVISLDRELISEFSSSENWEVVRRVRNSVLKARKKRTPPITDNKGISSWNFMMVSALVDVVQYCKIAQVKQLAMNLIESSLKSIHESFLLPLESQSGKLTIIQSTTKNEAKPLFENFVHYCENQFRLYELSSLELYKDNAQRSMRFIFNEFFDGENFLTRSIESDAAEPFENLPVGLFDQSYKSALSTFILLIRKWHFVFNEPEMLTKIEELMEKAKQEVLANPFGYGEALRALTYPQEAYKKIEIPRTWLNEEKFTQFLPYFSSRFAIVYTDEQSKWQLCNNMVCELTGNSIEEFEKAFKQESKNG